MSATKKRTAGRNDNGMGSIYKDGDGFRIAVSLGKDPETGKMKYKKMRFQDHAEAVTELKKLQTRKDQGKALPTNLPTLGEYLDTWLESVIKPLREEATYRQYEWIVRNHIKPTLGKKKLDQVKRKDVQLLIAVKSATRVAARLGEEQPSAPKRAAKWLEAKDRERPLMSKSSLRLIRAVLQSAYSDAKKDDLTASDPTDGVEIPKAPKKPPAFLTPAEALKLTKQTKKESLGLLFDVMLCTGMRPGEAAGLRWSDIDTTTTRIHVQGQLQRVGGELQYKDQTKTNRDRIVPIPKTIADRLEALRSEQLIDNAKDIDGIAFLTIDNKRLDPKYVYNQLKSACESAGIKQVSPHKLRHTAATLALAETGDLHGVQKMLGHSQVSLTSDLYGHATAETLRSVSNAIEKMLRPTETES